MADGLRVSHHLDEPLQHFTVVLEGTGQSFADAADVLRDEAGPPVDLAFELEWKPQNLANGLWAAVGITLSGR